MSIKRFGYDVRSGDNTIAQSVGGFATRQDAETAAERKREEIRRRGWNMRVHVTEAHAIARPVCPNCGQWINPGAGNLPTDCLNECHRRGLA